LRSPGERRYEGVTSRRALRLGTAVALALLISIVAAFL
jgi:hypothetical protein